MSVNSVGAAPTFKRKVMTENGAWYRTTNQGKITCALVGGGTFLALQGFDAIKHPVDSRLLNKLVPDKLIKGSKGKFALITALGTAITAAICLGVGAILDKSVNYQRALRAELRRERELHFSNKNLADAAKQVIDERDKQIKSLEEQVAKLSSRPCDCPQPESNSSLPAPNAQK